MNKISIDMNTFESKLIISIEEHNVAELKPQYQKIITTIAS